LTGGKEYPPDLTPDNKYTYDFMIHTLSKTYGISPIEAGKLTENDFWLCQGFEGFQNLREKWDFDTNRDNHT